MRAPRTVSRRGRQARALLGLDGRPTAPPHPRLPHNPPTRQRPTIPKRRVPTPPTPPTFPSSPGRATSYPSARPGHGVRGCWGSYTPPPRPSRLLPGPLHHYPPLPFSSLPPLPLLDWRASVSPLPFPSLPSTSPTRHRPHHPPERWSLTLPPLPLQAVIPSMRQEGRGDIIISSVATLGIWRKAATEAR